ncbi:hypothetical protein U1Q18_052191, partial [Sarracenia purpurea var. burkii]
HSRCLRTSHLYVAPPTAPPPMPLLYHPAQRHRPPIHAMPLLHRRRAPMPSCHLRIAPLTKTTIPLLTYAPCLHRRRPPAPYGAFTAIAPLCSAPCFPNP